MGSPFVLSTWTNMKHTAAAATAVHIRMVCSLRYGEDLPGAAVEVEGAAVIHMGFKEEKYRMHGARRLLRPKVRSAA